ncbi:MAG TPA: hypothetical protein ENN69_07915 [Spirochaetia bacterium]|nr:hypothetical protein [Spirochaetia bacterium]
MQGLSAAGVKLFLHMEFTPAEEGTEELTVTPSQREAYLHKLKEYRKKIPAVFLNLPADEEAAGGCLAAGRGFVHISAQGAVEPCPFSPFSDTNITESTLAEALQSEFLARLRAHPEELHETGGGCVLWQKRAWVTELLAESRGPAGGAVRTESEIEPASVVG